MAPQHKFCDKMCCGTVEEVLVVIVCMKALPITEVFSWLPVRWVLRRLFFGLRALACFVGTLTLLALPAAASVVIFQSYDGSTPGVGGQTIQRQLTGGGPPAEIGVRAAVGFTTDAMSYNLDSVTVHMQQFSFNTVRLSLYSDSGGSPGSSLVELTNPGIAGAANYLFAGGGHPLAASTAYWLVMQPVDTAPVSASWTIGTSGSSYQVSSLSDTWGAWGANASTPPSAYVLATAVPEPSAWGWVAGVALLGFTALRQGSPFRVGHRG